MSHAARSATNGDQDPHPDVHRTMLTVPVICLAASVVCFALLTAWAMSSPPLGGGMDYDIHHWVLTHRTPTLVDVAAFVTTWGSAPVVGPLVFVGVFVVSPGPLVRRLTLATKTLGVLVSGLLLRLAVSDLVARARPPSQDWAYPARGYSFPSGHTAGAALGAVLLAWSFTPHSHRPRTRAAAWVVAAAVALAVGWTRIYLGVHWPSDVLGSWALSVAWLSAALLLFRWRWGADAPSRVPSSDRRTVITY